MLGVGIVIVMNKTHIELAAVLLVVLAAVLSAAAKRSFLFRIGIEVKVRVSGCIYVHV